MGYINVKIDDDLHGDLYKIKRKLKMTIKQVQEEALKLFIEKHKENLSKGVSQEGGHGTKPN